MSSPIPRGIRFAPSPTGRFHVGNLRTAWVSWHWARELGEPWVVRFEDIDGPRVLAGAQARQLADLAALGMVPDEVRVQSQSLARHRAVFERAAQIARIYPCRCSRKEVQTALAQIASAPQNEASPPVYTGHCRPTETCELRWDPRDSAQIAWRLRNPAGAGERDFIIARTVNGEFQPAYHWACAIDDFDGAYRWLVRAWDLAPALPLQRRIHDLLAELEGARPYPEVFHTALVVAEGGARLEKRTQGITWPELQATGWDRDRLLAAFAASLQERRPMAPGEAQKELFLRALCPS